jgi:Amt family ammonium transporter
MCLPGLAVFYGGMVRRKNVLSVLAQCFAVTCVASLAWAFIGYPISIGPAADCGEWLCAWRAVGHLPAPRGAMHGTVPEAAYLMFQMTFAVIAPVLALGGFAERMRFPAILIYSFLWSVVVYAPVVHWVWGNGWLAHRGIMDFSGGLVVHVTSGVSALVGAYTLGHRELRHAAHTPHSLPLVAIGGGMLWVGWFGFNGGSALAANEDAAMAILTTQIAGCAGALTWMGVESLRFRKPSVSGLLMGAVAGLVTITPACGYVSPLGSAVIGAIGGLIAFATLRFVRAVVPVDDALDVSSIHGMAGVTGALLTGVFAGTMLGGEGFPAGHTLGQQLTIQGLGVLAVVIWTAVASYALLWLTDRWVGLRVDDLEEQAGLDIAEFGESGYAD